MTAIVRSLKCALLSSAKKTMIPGVRSTVLMILTLAWPALASSQAQVPAQANSPEHSAQNPTYQRNPPSVEPSDLQVARSDQKPAPAEDKKNDGDAQQSKRMFYVIPNFAAVDAHTQLPPLSTREKFVLATHDSLIDYSSFVWTGILAAQAMT